jgi:hypothetical protein
MVPIKDVDPHVFGVMIELTYGKDVSPNVWKEYGKEILVAARQFGFSTIRDSAEIWYLKFLHLTVHSAQCNQRTPLCR